jgi:integrase/recombinase XerD
MREPNLYARAGVYWLRITLNGVEHRESLRTRNIKIARRQRDKRIEQINATHGRGENNRPWLQAVTEWAQHEAGQLSPSTAKRYAVSLDQVRPYLEHLSIGAIDGSAIATLIAKRKAIASPATVRRDLTAVSRVMDYAEAMGWREGNPTLSKRRLLRERRDPIALPSPVEVDAIIDAASTRFGALICAARLTGCRQNELVTATWRSFDLAGKKLAVIGKGNKRRTLKLSDEATAHIAAQSRVAGSGLIFCREDGSAFAQAASDFTHLRRSVEAKARKEGQPFHRFRFHDLRHLFAVEWLKSGASLYDLQQHLGHTSIKTTEIYLEFLAPEEAASAKSSTTQNTAQLRRFTGDENDASVGSAKGDVI